VKFFRRLLLKSYSVIIIYVDENLAMESKIVFFLVSNSSLRVIFRIFISIPSPKVTLCRPANQLTRRARQSIGLAHLRPNSVENPLDLNVDNPLDLNVGRMLIIINYIE
jgi:hypothetical protein